MSSAASDVYKRQVTTRVGAEGIEIENGKHLLVEDDPVRMAERIDALLTDPALWNRLQTASRTLIQQRYTWRKLFQNMHRAIEQSLKEQSRCSGLPGNSVVSHAG